MHRSPLILGLAAVFAGMTALLAIGAVVSGSLVALFVAAPFGLTSYFMYYHGSGKLAQAVSRQQQTRARRARREPFRERGGFGAGPRARGATRTRAAREAREAFGRGDGPRSDQRRRHAPSRSGRTTRAEARTVLGVGVDADASEIRRAYREKVKDVHPDRGGDEDEFKRVTAAYERLSG